MVCACYIYVLMPVTLYLKRLDLEIMWDLSVLVFVCLQLVCLAGWPARQIKLKKTAYRNVDSGRGVTVDLLLYFSTSIPNTIHQLPPYPTNMPPPDLPLTESLLLAIHMCPLFPKLSTNLSDGCNKKRATYGYPYGEGN